MKEVNPKETSRAQSYELFIDAPMPMATLFKTIDVTNIVDACKKGYKFNMLFCHCIGSAAMQISEFKLLPKGKKLYEYDEIGISIMISNKNGQLNRCNIPYNEDREQFNQDYLKLTKQVYETCTNYEIEDAMMVGTSALVKYDIDGATGAYGPYQNPVLVWGKYVERDSRYVIKLSFQFHHVQLDGEQACRFLDELQNQIDKL